MKLHITEETLLVKEPDWLVIKPTTDKQEGRVVPIYQDMVGNWYVGSSPRVLLGAWGSDPIHAIQMYLLTEFYGTRVFDGRFEFHLVDNAKEAYAMLVPNSLR